MQLSSNRFIFHRLRLLQLGNLAEIFKNIFHHLRLHLAFWAFWADASKKVHVMFGEKYALGSFRFTLSQFKCDRLNLMIYVVLNKCSDSDVWSCIFTTYQFNVNNGAIKTAGCACTWPFGNNFTLFQLFIFRLLCIMYMCYV